MLRVSGKLSSRLTVVNIQYTVVLVYAVGLKWLLYRVLISAVFLKSLRITKQKRRFPSRLKIFLVFAHLRVRIILISSGIVQMETLR